MVRSCQIEDDVSGYFDGLLREREQVQVGLLLGRLGVGSRDMVYAVVKSPSQDGLPAVQLTTPAPSVPGKMTTRSAKGVKVSISIQEDWVAEHARQVARMLPGGLSVVGIYLYAPEPGLQSVVPELCRILREIKMSDPGAYDDSDHDPLLLHVDSVVKKYAVRSCPAGASAMSSLRLAETKFGPCISSLVCISCRYEVRLQLPAASHVQELQHAAAELVQAEAGRIRGALAAKDGALLPLDVPVAKLLQAGSPEDPQELQLLAPLPMQLQPGSSQYQAKQMEVQGQALVEGVMEGRAYVHSRELSAKAVEDLQADLARSLAARLALVVEDAQRWESEAQPEASCSGDTTSPGRGEGAQPDLAQEARHPLLRRGPLGRHAALPLPCRVLLPWKGGLKLCDYLSEGEEMDAVVQRAADLLDLKLSSSDEVLQVERLGTPTFTTSPWQPGASQPQPGMSEGAAVSSRRQTAPGSSTCILVGLSAGAVAGLAVLVGMLTLGGAQ